MSTRNVFCCSSVPYTTLRWWVSVQSRYALCQNVRVQPYPGLVSVEAVESLLSTYSAGRVPPIFALSNFLSSLLDQIVLKSRKKDSIFAVIASCLGQSCSAAAALAFPIWSFALSVLTAEIRIRTLQRSLVAWISCLALVVWSLAIE